MAKFDGIMGGRSNLSDEFVEEKDRDACLKIFEEYEKMDAKRY